MALVGVVARPHGRRGEVILNPETSFPDERFAVGQRLYMKRQDRIEPLTVTALKFHRERPIVGFDGCDSIEDAERLAGVELRVPDEALTKLPPGAYYHHELIGCAVETVTGQAVGSVVRVDGAGERTSLVVGGSHGEVMVPLVESICRQIDVANRRIVIEPPEGLLDLYS